MKYRRITLGLELGSAAIEERLVEIALLMRKTFPDCYWRQPEQNDVSRTAEMHVVVNGRDEPVCFTDRELINYSLHRRRPSLDHRMHAVLQRMLSE